MGKSENPAIDKPNIQVSLHFCVLITELVSLKRTFYDYAFITKNVFKTAYPIYFFLLSFPTAKKGSDRNES